MKSLRWKIFIPVLLAMIGLVLVSLLLLSSFTSHINQIAQQLVPQLYEEAKDDLLDSGRAGLVAWLEKNKNNIKGMRIFIIDDSGKDLLNRALPSVNEVIRGQNREFRGPRGRPPRGGSGRGSELREGRADDGRPRRSGRYPFLRTGDGQAYRFQLARPTGGFLGMLKAQRMFLPILFSMILLSALVSALIARRISQPIQRLRQGAQSFANGHLSERVSVEFSNRSDEIGDLARDFDVMAEKISGLVDSQQRLLRDVSHELRSPLARLQVALGLAEKRSGDQIKPELARIESEANLLNAMIGKILSLVRLNNLSIDNASLQWETINLVSMLKRLCADANYEAQEKSVRVNLQAPENLNIKVVPHLLSSAIENVLRNAVKYAPLNSEVKCVLTQDHGGVNIAIFDQGAGVSDAELEKIFEPFYRVSDAREHQQGSGGIGLAIAKRVLVLHQGSIEAFNTESGFVIKMRI